MKKKSKIYFLFDNFAYFCIRFENSRHLKGDEGQVEGEPLYLDNLRQGSAPPIAYVCGKKSGVRFETM